ncbi:MAG: phosphatidylglycerol lysyltransferase domain-containing protein [Solirubrobacteraceae bacterium]
MNPVHDSLLTRLASRWPRTVAGATALAAACGLLVGALLPSPRWERLLGPLTVDPAPVSALSHVLAASAGAALLLLARALWRGSRRAAQLAAGTLAVAGLLEAATGGSTLAVVAELAIGAMIVLKLGAFPRGAATRAPRLPVVFAAAVAGLGYGLAVVTLLVTDRAVGLGAALRRAGSWLVAGGWWLPNEAPLAVALDLALVAGLAVAGWWLHALLRPGPAFAGHSVAEHARAAEIVANHARDSLDAFSLREDKSYHFAHGGMLAYRTLRETAVVSGDPIGPPGSAPAILASFETEAAAHGWDVVVTAASPRELGGYREMGFRAVGIGEEAVVDTATFSLEGPAMKSVRKAIGRIARHGWTIEVVPGHALEPATVAAIERIESRWRSGRPRLQGFAMTLGRLWGAHEDEAARYVLGRDADGELSAFLRFNCYPAGLSLDVMRRTGDEPNGVNEAMIVAAIEHARAAGLTEVSLNFAGFSHIMVPRGPLNPTQRLGRRLLLLAHGRFQLERLARFNEKFGPRWEPRHLVYRQALGLPRAGLRVLQAEAYVRGPRQRPRRDGWRPRAAPLIRQPAAPAVAPPAVLPRS